MLGREATNINFILTRPGLEPTIYRTREEHANHYTAIAVIYIYIFFFLMFTLKIITIVSILYYIELANMTRDI